MVHYNRKMPKFKSKAEIYKKSKWIKFKEKMNLFWSNVGRVISRIAYKIHEKGSQKLTIMIVPHSEKRIINIGISNYIMVFSLILISIIVITSVISISGSQQAEKQVVRLQNLNETKKVQIDQFKDSIQKLNARMNIFKIDVNEAMKSTTGRERNIFNFPMLSMNDSTNEVKLKETSELERMGAELDVVKEHIQRMGDFIVNRKRLLRQLPSIYPLSARARITSPFGYRVDPVYRWQTEFHSGLDMACPPGTPIVAAADGEIESAGWHGGYGWMVKIKHPYQFSTKYAHMDRFALGINTGASVKQNQVIGYVGTTGKSTGYHLHYEVLIGGEAINPQPYISMLP